MSPALAGDSLPLSHPESPCKIKSLIKNKLKEKQKQQQQQRKTNLNQMHSRLKCKTKQKIRSVRKTHWYLRQSEKTKTNKQTKHLILKTPKA